MLASNGGTLLQKLRCVAPGNCVCFLGFLEKIFNNIFLQIEKKMYLCGYFFVGCKRRNLDKAETCKAIELNKYKHKA
jgi:hypothetical protein